MWISWKQLLISLQIYRATSSFPPLKSPELHGVVWGCFSRLLGKIATNLMICSHCPSLEGPGKFSCCAGHGCCGLHWGGIGKAPETGISALFLCKWHISFPKLQQKEPMDIYGRHLWGLSCCCLRVLPPVSIFSGSGITVRFEAFFSPFQQVKALAVLCQAVQAGTELCIGKHFWISPSHQICCACSPWFCIGGNGAYLRAGAPWGWGAPLGMFSLQPSEKCLIEILSLPGIILREADECCGKKVLFLPRDFFLFKSWSKPESKSLISCYTA